MKHQPYKSSEQLKEFGEVMALACFVFTALSIYKHTIITGGSLGLISFGSIFLLLGLFFPRTLAKPEQLWMALAEKISVVMTFIIMLLTFLLVVTPIGLALRIFGKDLLGKKFDKSRQSYWEPMEQNGPGSRYYLPY